MMLMNPNTKEKLQQLISEKYNYSDLDLWCNKNFVLDAVAIDGNLLLFANDELKDDKDVVLVAVKHNFYECGYPYASDRQRYNKELTILAVDIFGMFLQHTSDRLRNDKETVLHAIKQYGNALMFASDTLKDDEEVVSLAACNFAYSLQYASYRLRNNKSFMKKVVSYNGEAIDYATDNIKNDKDIFITALKNDLVVLRNMPKKFSCDADVKNVAVQIDPSLETWFK